MKKNIIKELKKDRLTKYTAIHFIKEIRNGIALRDRISIAKGSSMYYEKGKYIESTYSINALPSHKTLYVENIMYMGSHKIYAELAVLKGMNKRPRQKLTLGNMVMLKDRKILGKPIVKNTERISNQVEGQYVRTIWDILNRHMLKKYRKYVDELRVNRGKTFFSSKQKDRFIRMFDHYIIVRECEVYRNAYEVISLQECTKNGEIRKKWRIYDKYLLTPNRNKVKTWIDTNIIQSLGTYESKTLDIFYEKRVKDRKEAFEEKYMERKNRVREIPERKKVHHIHILIERSERTSMKPRQQPTAEQVDWSIYYKKVEHFRKKYIQSEPLFDNTYPYRIYDNPLIKLQRVIPTTQYFAKMKNLIRIKDRDNVKRDLTGNPLLEHEYVKKVRKVPEDDKMERYPQWSELERMCNKRIQHVENDNLQHILKGKEVDMSYAKYRELTKRVIYYYIIVRTKF